MDVSDDNKATAKFLAQKFGGKASVAKFWDAPEENAIAILTCRDAPQEHVNSYATVTLASHPIYEAGKVISLRTEIVAACDAAVEDFENVLSTCAFNVIKDKWSIGPGIVFRDVISLYDMSGTMAHVMFVTPFLWDLPARDGSVGKIAFLQAIPISESEYLYASENGPDALESLFEQEQIDVYDIDRPPVV